MLVVGVVAVFSRWRIYGFFLIRLVGRFPGTDGAPIRGLGW